MSRFNHYAKKLEELTFEAVKELREAIDTEKKTAKALSEHPERHGFVDLEYQNEYLRRKLAHEEATAKLQKVSTTVPNELSKQLSELRSKLKSDADYYFAVDPSQLQPEVVSFLDSGMLNVNDYQKLMKAAVSDNNVSMIRMISNRANKAAENISDDRERATLKIIAAEAEKYTTDNYLTAFDGLISVSEKCMNNPRLADYWNTDLGIGQVVEGF